MQCPKCGRLYRAPPMVMLEEKPPRGVDPRLRKFECRNCHLKVWGRVSGKQAREAR